MHKDTLARLESVGVEAVLREMAEGKHGQPTSQARDEVEAWVRSKQFSAEVAASAKRDAREEETLAIAKSAKDSVRWDRRIAITAVIIAAIAAREDIAGLISYVLRAIGF